MNQKQKNLFGALFLLGVSVLVLFLFFLFLPERGNKVFQVRLEGKIFQLEVAQTPEARRVGLGNREELCAQCGMLFLFDEPEKHGFWMKDMRFAIDIVWLRGDTVIWIERSIPPDSQKIFYPDRPAERVLEFNAGASKDLETGEQIQFFH